MKRIGPIVATIYVLATQGSVVSKSRYEGMDQATVQTLITDTEKSNPGSSYAIVSKQEFDLVPDPVVSVIADPVKAQAILDAKDARLSVDQRLNALIKAIDLR